MDSIRGISGSKSGQGQREADIRRQMEQDQARDRADREKITGPSAKLPGPTGKPQDPDEIRGAVKSDNARDAKEANSLRDDVARTFFDRLQGHDDVKVSDEAHESDSAPSAHKLDLGKPE